MMCRFFFFKDNTSIDMYTLSLHDALPIYVSRGWANELEHASLIVAEAAYACGLHCVWPSSHFEAVEHRDRKSTRLNSSHSQTSYAVFCLKKKNVLRFSGERRRASRPPVWS